MWDSCRVEAPNPSCGVSESGSAEVVVVGGKNAGLIELRWLRGGFVRYLGHDLDGFDIYRGLVESSTDVDKQRWVKWRFITCLSNFTPSGCN